MSAYLYHHLVTDIPVDSLLPNPAEDIFFPAWHWLLISSDFNVIIRKGNVCYQRVEEMANKVMNGWL